MNTIRRLCLALAAGALLYGPAAAQDKWPSKPIIDKLQQKVVQIMTDPAMREKSERTGAFPMTSTPEEFGQFIRQEAGRWQKVLQETNIKYD